MSCHDIGHTPITYAAGLAKKLIRSPNHPKKKQAMHLNDSEEPEMEKSASCPSGPLYVSVLF